MGEDLGQAARVGARVPPALPHPNTHLTSPSHNPESPPASHATTTTYPRFPHPTRPHPHYCTWLRLHLLNTHECNPNPQISDLESANAALEAELVAAAAGLAPLEAERDRLARQREEARAAAGAEVQTAEEQVGSSCP